MRALTRGRPERVGPSFQNEKGERMKGLYAFIEKLDQPQLELLFELLQVLRDGDLNVADFAWVVHQELMTRIKKP